MKTRYWIIALFVLILPLSLYFMLHHSFELPTSPIKVNKITPSKPSISLTKETASTTSSPIKREIQHWVTNTGARVFFVATHEIPMLDIQVDFDAGSARDGNKPGLAMLMSRLLDKGIEGLNANQIAEKFEDAGVQYQATIDRDKLTASLRTLTSQTQFNSCIDLFAKLLANGNYLDQTIEREKKLMSVELKQKEQLPNVIAAKAFFKELYQDHPYGHPIFGTEEGIAKISKTDLTAFHQQYFVGNNTTITLVGDITQEQAKDIANQLSQKLDSGKSPNPLPPVPKLRAPQKVTINFPSEQTHVMLGQPCAIQGDPDFFALMVGNYILGGNFLNSRLFKEVRDERGLVYSVASALRQYQQSGPFLIQLQTKNDQTQEAISVVNQVLEQFIKEGPTEQEVSEAKEGIINGFPLDISSNAKMTNAVSTIGFYKLPLDYLDVYQQKVQEITTAKIKETFERRLDPNYMALITVRSLKHETQSD